MLFRSAGLDASSVLMKVREGKGAFGLNAATETYEDLVKAGVIDPTKVVRVALQNAASVSGLMLTTEALIAERPDKGPVTPQEAAPPPQNNSSGYEDEHDDHHDDDH